MKTTGLWLSVIVAIAIAVSGPAHGEMALGTAFTYQGRLTDGDSPATGIYEFEFRIYDAHADPSNQVGDTYSLRSVQVIDGLFTVKLDFGGDAFNGNARWLQIAVRPQGTTEPHAVLSPRQELTAAPYALYAMNAGGGGSLWAANGNDIHNTNSARVGIGTASPNFNLDVLDTGGLDAPPATFGVRWKQPALPDPIEDWFYFAVGGSAPSVGTGTRLIRESGTDLHFQTRDGINVGSPSTQMVLTETGKVGIGTMNPGAMLDVETSTGVHGIQSTTSGIPISAHRNGTSGTWPAIHAECDSQSENASAIRAFITDTDPGYGSAAVRGVNNGKSVGYGVHGTHAGSGWGVFGEAPSGRAVYGLSVDGIGVYGKSTNGHAGVFEGKVSVKVLEITGADLAEKFPVSEKVGPGMVVAIDPKHPGQLCLARGAYNRCVAGVVSGANNLPAGAVLGHLPGSEDAPAVALTGRVWVRCDAKDHSIEPGDLLTTSDIPGHAMKATDRERAYGATIGKAMTGLKKSSGLVLVLVNLQ
jgi:hypothetical protein